MESAQLSVLREFALQNNLQIHPATGEKKYKDQIRIFLGFAPLEVEHTDKTLAEITGKNPENTQIVLYQREIAHNKDLIVSLQRQLTQANKKVAIVGKASTDVYYTPKGVMSKKEVQDNYPINFENSLQFLEDEARKLIRIIVQPNNPNESELDGLSFTYGAVGLNNSVPFRRYVFFGRELLVENMVYQGLLAATFI